VQRCALQLGKNLLTLAIKVSKPSLNANRNVSVETELDLADAYSYLNDLTAIQEAQIYVTPESVHVAHPERSLRG
jgi:hypothetical protein